MPHFDRLSAWILGGSGEVSFDGEVGQVGLFGAVGIMLQADRFTDLVQELDTLRGGRDRVWHRLIDKDEICLVLITHSHSDHTSGIRFFDCPILAHKLACQRIKKRDTERAKTRMPTDCFEDRRDLESGI